MGFRRDNKTDERRWRKKNRQKLIEAGIPDAILDDDRKWNYVLLHGDDEFESRWDTSWITDDQSKALLELLKGFYEEWEGYELIAILERRLKTNA